MLSRNARPRKSIDSGRDILGREAVSADAADRVRLGALEGGETLPVLIEPAVEGLDLAAWLEGGRDLLEQHLGTRGAVLFRGFDLRSREDLERAVQAASGSLLEYSFRSTPRKEVGGRVYTSTEYPQDQHIPLHNEMSYTSQWPLRIWFLSVEPAAEGGETPLADSRRVYQRIPSEIRERFARLGVLYVRNYGGGLDLPWEEVFQTADRGEVERFCAEAGIAHEWLAGNRLRTRQVCQAVAVHPQTGETVWFNQAHLFHVSSLPRELREHLLARLPEEDLPRNTYYGDGSPIEPAALEAVREAFDRESVAFPWRRGDLLAVDNMLVAHGRRPFRGPRKVLVAMAQPFPEAR